MKKVELLAPAGDLEKLKYAFLYGADAVYVAGPGYGLRANATNFTFEELKKGAEIANKLNKKIYVTVNIVLHNKELIGLKKYLQELEKTNVNAIIVSDPYIIDIAKKYTNLEIHLSTQQSTINKEAFEFFKNEGVSRIVFAREASEIDIKDVIDNVDIETEVFIHGAMCSSYSGRCVMSNVLTARDANRGGCSQICRWDFSLLEDDKDITKDKPFSFCTKDLSNLKYIHNMIDLGITSFKIEGRMRSIYYLATVLSIYRKCIDDYYNKSKKSEYNKRYEQILDNVANRESISQFYDGTNDETGSYYNNRQELSNQDFLGVILDYDSKNNLALVEQRNYFKIGDVVEVFGPNKVCEMKIEKILDEEDNFIEIVRHPKQLVKIVINFPVERYDLIRIKK